MNEQHALVPNVYSIFKFSQSQMKWHLFVTLCIRRQYNGDQLNYSREIAMDKGDVKNRVALNERGTVCAVIRATFQIYGIGIINYALCVVQCKCDNLSKCERWCDATTSSTEIEAINNIFFYGIALILTSLPAVCTPRSNAVRVLPVQSFSYFPLSYLTFRSSDFPLRNA